MVYIGELYVECLLKKSMFMLIQIGASCKWVNDSQRLLLEWFDAICESPFQLYRLALQCCPSSSWLHKCYATKFSQEIKVVKGDPVEWGKCFRTVMLDHLPWVLTCWKDTIAVGLSSGDIITLDGVTGSQTAVFSGHTHNAAALAFSPDGTSLVSGSKDKTIKLWDVQTGGVIKTFHGHTSYVDSVSVSADCAMIASGSQDMTIRLWIIQTEECHCIIKQQDWRVHVRFSPSNPQQLISVSGNKIQQWDINGHQTNPTYNGSHVSFSLDGTEFVSCQGKAVVVQNSHSGVLVAKNCVTNGRTRYCCFSPNGRLIAFAINSTAYIWDIAGSDLHSIKTFVGHTNITSLAFTSSSTLISSSHDKSVKFWQISAFTTDSAMTDPESTTLAPAPISSVNLQATDGIVISCDAAGVVRIWNISTGLCKASFQTPFKNHSGSCVRLIGSRLISAWRVEAEGAMTMGGMPYGTHIWDVEKGEFLKNVYITTSNDHLGIRISEDGSKIFSLGSNMIHAWSIQTGMFLSSVELEPPKHKRSFTMDGSRVWAHSPQQELVGWDFGVPGSRPVQLSKTSSLHPNYTKLWDVAQSRIKDAVTGKVVFQLAGRLSNPVDSQWDGRYLVAGYESGEVLILDFNHMPLSET